MSRRLQRGNPMALTADFETNSPLAERAKALLPLIDEYQAYSDEEGELAPPVVEAFHDAGMFKMWIPEMFGGGRQATFVLPADGSVRHHLPGWVSAVVPA